MKKQETEVMTTEMPLDMTEQQKEAIFYKSKLLNKYFDTWEELVEEETAYKKAHDEELKAKEEKAKALEAIKDAYKNYLAVVNEQAKAVKEAWCKYVELRNDFAEKYHGYHMTYYNDGTSEEVNFNDAMGDIQKAFNNLLSIL